MRPAVTTTPRLLGALGLTVLVSAPLVAQPPAAGPGPAPTVARGAGPGRPAARRTARRRHLRRDPGHQRLRPAGAVRVRAGHREDRRLDLLRRRSDLRVGPLLREPAGAPRRQRDASRHQPAAPERHLRGAVRHLPRPPQRLHLLRQRHRRLRRQPGHRRGPAQRRLEHGVDGPHGGIRRRLDDRDGDSLQVAALRPGPRADLGDQPAAGRALEERMVVPGPRAARADHLPRHPEGLVGGHAHRPGSAGRQPHHRAEAVRPQRALHRPDRGAAVGAGLRGAGRRRLQVRADPELHRRPDRQHRLRPGRSRRAAGQPHPLQPVLPREARLLPRRRRHVRLRRPGQRRARRRQRRHALSLLQPAHRPRRRGRDPAAGRRAAHRQERPHHGRRPQRPDRLGRWARRRLGELHRAAGQARHPQPQCRRRHVHASHGDAGPAGQQRRRRRRRQLRVLPEPARRQLPGGHPVGGRRRRTISATAASWTTTPIATACKWSGWRSNPASCPRSASCAAPTSAATSPRGASARGRGTSPPSASSPPRPA